MGDAITITSALQAIGLNVLISWAVKGGLMQEFSWIIYSVLIINFFKLIGDDLGKNLMVSTAPSTF